LVFLLTAGEKDENRSLFEEFDVPVI